MSTMPAHMPNLLIYKQQKARRKFNVSVLLNQTSLLELVRARCPKEKIRANWSRFFTDWTPFLLPNWQCPDTEGRKRNWEKKECQWVPTVPVGTGCIAAASLQLKLRTPTAGSWPIQSTDPKTAASCWGYLGPNKYCGPWDSTTQMASQSLHPILQGSCLWSTDRRM